MLQNGQHTCDTVEVGGPREREPGHIRAKMAAHSSLLLSRGTKGGVRLWRDLKHVDLLVCYIPLVQANDLPL